MTNSQSLGDIREALHELLADVDRMAVPARAQPGATWLACMEKLVGLALGLTAAQYQELCAMDPRFALPCLARHYSRFIQVREIESVRALLGGSLKRPDVQLAGDFARRAFLRVKDMFDAIDFSGCSRFVMVGCGPLPVTLLQVAERTQARSLVGLDIDSISIEHARKLMGYLRQERVRIHREDGGEYNYASADVVYVANLVRPKARVLARIADTAPGGTQVIVREPLDAGRLFTEAGADRLDSRFRITGQGPGDSLFLSRHVFLQTIDAETW